MICGKRVMSWRASSQPMIASWKNRKPEISVSELADSSVNFNVRPWVKSEDYWAVRSDVIEKIKLAFDENGISIPYPQMDVHMNGAD